MLENTLVVISRSTLLEESTNLIDVYTSVDINVFNLRSQCSEPWQPMRGDVFSVHSRVAWGQLERAHGLPVLLEKGWKLLNHPLYKHLFTGKMWL